MTCFRACLFALVLWPLAVQGADAGPNPEAVLIQAQLSVLTQQQQSLFQQFQMLQELRRMTLQSDIRTFSYEEQVRYREERDDRTSQISAELADTYRRHRELEDQKTRLLQRLGELSVPQLSVPQLSAPQ